MSEQWERVFTQLNPKSPIAEAFRVLRTNIQFAGVDKPLKAISLTSAGPGEGKTTTLANLAVALAQSGAKVILVDGDLRRPAMHKFFRLSRRTGLSSVIMGRAKPAEALQATDVPGLSLLSSGPVPPNPSELLGSEAFTALLGELKASADHVLVDSPPVVAVADASIIAAKVDGTLLVVRLGATARPMALRAREQLVTAKANLLGMVLTDVGAGTDYNYYYHYYYHYRDSREG
ncbi:MAG: CpsD/CapB family tyrosine-protein kinase [Patescibacteria group bacterium]